jgi:hypothetical protein
MTDKTNPPMMPHWGKIPVLLPIWLNDGKYYFSLRQIVGSVAGNAVRQSPYGNPDNLNAAISRLSKCLEQYFTADPVTGYRESYVLMSGKEIEKILLTEFTKVAEIMAWNLPKKEGGPEFASSSRYHTTPPDYDYIDLDALARNVCHDLLKDACTNEALEKNKGEME